MAMKCPICEKIYRFKYLEYCILVPNGDGGLTEIDDGYYSTLSILKSQVKECIKRDLGGGRLTSDLRWEYT